MASRFWVPVLGVGTGTWDASDTTHWSATSGGLGGSSVPGSGDTVTFDANSCPLGETVTVNTDFNVTSVTMGAFTGTLDFSANNNSPTMQTFSGTGTGVRTISFGSGNFTITSGVASALTFGTTTNLTVSANTATIIFTGANASASLGSINFNGLSLSFTGGGTTMGLTGNGTTTLKNLTVTGTAVTTDTFVFNGTNVFTGTMTFAGNSAVNTLAIKSNTAGTLRTETFGSGVFTNIKSWTDISLTMTGPGLTTTLTESLNLASATAFPTLTLTSGTFDAGGFNVTCGIFNSSNSNTRVLTMGSGTWTLTGSGTTIWTTATATNLTLTGSGTVNCTYSGSTGSRTFANGTGASIALNNVSVSAGSDTFITNTTSATYNGNLNFTGFTGSWTIGSNSLGGNLILGTGMTTTSGSNILSFVSTGSQSITSNNVSIAAAVTINGVGNTTTLQDDFTMGSTKTLGLSSGTFNANNKNVSVGLFSSSNSTTRTLTMGSGTWTLTGTGTVWNTATVTNMTLNANTSTVVINDASSSSKTFAGGVMTFYNLQLTGAGTGTFIIGNTTGTTTFNAIIVDTPPHTVQVFAGKTLNIAAGLSVAISGTASNLNVFQSTTNGTAWNIVSTSGQGVSANYISLQDSHASGANFYAGMNSTNVSGNTGWDFTSRQAASGFLPFLY